ncbi:hypothetical protein [Paraglaciecola sp.]|uniref:hypothetical protein n=1 Tax=Paraglaciecola sp. TaxID=1920173 RepID=UPI0030F3E703
MLRLSRKAWNNVIIISMLVLIVMFNTTTNFLSGGGADSAGSPFLIPEDALIATMEFDDYKVERVGQGWRALGINSEQADLVALTQAWHNAQIEQNATDLNITQATASEMVYIWLVGHKTPLKFEVFQLDKLTLVLSQQRLYQLSDTEFSSLFLSGIKDA